MKILQVCNSDFYLSKFLVPLVIELKRRGHAVECVCEGPAVDERLAQNGVIVHRFQYPKRAQLLEFTAAIGRMRRLMRAGRYACVNSHNRNASVVARVAAWLEKVPLNIYTAHGFYFHDGQSVLARSLSILVERSLARITDYTLSQSVEDLQFVIRAGIIPAGRIRHIGNGIDRSKFSPKYSRDQCEAELGLRAGVFRIGAVGRIVKGKGFEDLLEAFATFTRTVESSELLIVGGNIEQDIEPFQANFENRIRQLGLLSKVRVTGIVANVEHYLATVDVFVLPSYREGVPRSLLEAMSMGLPCIATNIRGPREIIDAPITGVLYQAGKVSQLVSHLFRWYEQRHERLAVAAASQDAVRQYDEHEYVLRQVAAIEEFAEAEAVA